MPVAVYMLQQQPITGTLYLTQLYREFELPSKIYGIEDNFIDRVEKTYRNTKGNIGVLMNGVKGTGKTVTAKQIANNLRIPVIVIKDRFTNTPDFLNSLQEDVILFFDEYEKVYDDYDDSILTVMDGVLSNEYRKLFLLTTNHAYVNENMLQRPGRIRYFKTFGDLSQKSIVEIIDDKLVNKEFKDELIKFISNLEIITVDIVCSVIEEVSIHNEVPEVFKDVFNVKAMEDQFDVFIPEENGKQSLLYSRVEVDPTKPTKACVGRQFRVNGMVLGRIVEAIKDRGFKVKSIGKPRILDVGTEKYTEMDNEFYKDQVEEGSEVDESGSRREVITTYFIERNSGLHKVFSSYAF